MEKIYEDYISLIKEYNEKINLVSKKDINKIYTRHILDSLFIKKFLNFENKTAIDIGSGAGFPGIPLAISNPSLKIDLYEPIKKRANFLNLVKNTLKLNNVRVINKRIEERDIKNKVDFVVSRATFSLPILLELSVPFLKTKGLLISYKGEKYLEEMESSKNALIVLNSKVINVYKKENSENTFGVNIIIEKEDDVDLKYPRNFSVIKKRPL